MYRWCACDELPVCFYISYKLLCANSYGSSDSIRLYHNANPSGARRPFLDPGPCTSDLGPLTLDLGYGWAGAEGISDTWCVLRCLLSSCECFTFVFLLFFSVLRCVCCKKIIIIKLIQLGVVKHFLASGADPSSRLGLPCLCSPIHIIQSQK